MEKNTITLRHHKAAPITCTQVHHTNSQANPGCMIVDQADLETAAEEVRVHLKETTRQLQKQRGETLHPGFDLVGTSDKERAQFVASGSTKSS
eukprot:m.260266 g.260266  ORF g.260266 m.260266 type:complete len:93 (+) comp15557_c0_seq1:873-1151(+)